MHYVLFKSWYVFANDILKDENVQTKMLYSDLTTNHFFTTNLHYTTSLDEKTANKFSIPYFYLSLHPIPSPMCCNHWTLIWRKWKQFRNRFPFMTVCIAKSIYSNDHKIDGFIISILQIEITNVITVIDWRMLFGFCLTVKDGMIRELDIFSVE